MQPKSKALLAWVIPLLLLTIWEVLSGAGFFRPNILPAPSQIARAVVDLAQQGDLFVHLESSLWRAALGWSIGAGIGFSLGISVGLFPLIRALLDPTIMMIRAIPFLAFLPLLIVWLGIGESQKIFMVAFAVTFPMYVNTILGIRQVDPKLIELGHTQGLSQIEIVRKIVFPGALPSIFMGVRYSLASAWLALVIAETVGASSGIGFLASDAREFLRVDIIIFTVILYALIGLSADVLVKALERRFLAWHPNYGRPS